MTVCGTVSPLIGGGGETRRRDVVMTSLHHDDGIEILATSTTMTSGVCATSRMIDIGLTLVSATNNDLQRPPVTLK